MSYFNHAFQKTFVGTNGFQTGGQATNQLTLGEFSFYTEKKTNNYAAWEQVTNSEDAGCCPLVLVAGSIHPQDKIGPFHGGYSESVKSKVINPKYVQRFYKVLPCTPQQAQITVGANVDNYTGSCAKEFLCGETYSLRLDIKGSPALRYLTRNSYYTSGAYTGCCPADAIAPTPVNPLIVYTKWAYDFLNSILINPFIHVTITYSTDAGLNWQAFEPVNADDSTTAEALLPYTLEGAAFPPGTDENTLAGLIITGAYADTRFSDCTFYPNDSIIAFLEPVKLFASEVDLNGDPCTFTGLCENDICEPLQLKGTGENVIRDLILTEGYMQQPFYTGTDLRIREITNGTDVTEAISRSSYYTRYYLQHSVPRFNNPTGTFDNDQYLLEIVGAPEFNALITSTVVYTALTNTSVFTVASALGAYVGGAINFNGGFDQTTITAINGNTITVTGDRDAYTIDDTVTFFDASLITFENFVNEWLGNCGACETMIPYICPATCTPVDPNGSNAG
jgi:hypothetical protein